ncbi:MAG: hypothetical protein V2A65_01775 [Candidatus Omnitrophota bacterium]
MRYLLVQRKTWEKVANAHPLPKDPIDPSYTPNIIQRFGLDVKGEFIQFLWYAPKKDMHSNFGLKRIKWTPKLRGYLRQLLKG